MNAVALKSHEHYANIFLRFRKFCGEQAPSADLFRKFCRRLKYAPASQVVARAAIVHFSDSALRTELTALTIDGLSRFRRLPLSSVAEVEAVHAAVRRISDPCVRLIAQFILCTGCQVQEVVDIRRYDCETVDDEVWVNVGNRVVALPLDFMREINLHFYHPSAFLFTSQKRPHRFNRKTIWRKLKGWGFHPRQLRRVRISQLIHEYRETPFVESLLADQLGIVEDTASEILLFAGVKK